MMPESTEVRKVEIPLVWRRVLLADGKPFRWHHSPVRYARDREQLQHAHVYKWVLRDANSVKLYFGEASAFDQRLQDYRNPTPNSTEERVRQEMEKCEQRGGTVELWFLETPGDAFQLNGSSINRYSMGDKNIRLILENLAILEERQNKTALINVIPENAYYVKLATILDELVRIHGRETALNMIEGLLKSPPTGSEQKGA